VESRFGPLEESITVSPMVLQGDEAQVEARFIPFGHSVNLDAR
jgi:hypothetical protein